MMDRKQKQSADSVRARSRTTSVHLVDGKPSVSRSGTMSQSSKRLLLDANPGSAKPREKGQKTPIIKSGVVPSEEALKKMAAGKIGFRHTETTKQKISNAKIGIVPSEETRKKMSAAKIGFRHTETTKRKMSAAKKGRTITEAHRRNISIARRASSAARRASESASGRRGALT